DTSDSVAKPSLLVRTKEPFQRYKPIADYFSQHGYNFIIQYTRGSLESGGKDSFFLTDGSGKQQDGRETLEWISSQPWSDGKIGAFGFGIDGFLAHLLITTDHPAMRGAYIMAAPYNFYKDVVFPGGAYRKNFVETWTNKVDAKYLLHTFMMTPYTTSFWHPLSNERQVKMVKIPVCHVGGWYQPFLRGTVSAYNALEEKGMTPGKLYQNLIMGPWTQDQESYSRTKQGDIDFSQNSTFDYVQHAHAFFDRWVKNQPQDSLSLVEVAQQKKVNYFMMGDENTAGSWTESDSWPPENIKYEHFYLQKNGMLGRGKADINGNAEAFRYDPLIPLETNGGANYYLPSGPMDQREIEKKNDVLTFTSDILSKPVKIAGPLRFLLYASSSTSDTDFTVQLTDIYPDGRSMLLADGIIRARHRNTTRESELLEPKKVEQYEIDLGHIAKIFSTGHRIRINISSSNSPKFEPNPNSAKPFHRNKTQHVTINYVYYGGKRNSAVILPVIE
ncbi:MAG: CocE/NonD family hydrolase, partial [Calditrichaeota bacterium]